MHSIAWWCWQALKLLVHPCPLQVGVYKALLDTAAGLDYLHSIGVVHGDLKAANVLLRGSTKDARGFICKITDFGLSRVLDRNATHISTGTYGEQYFPLLPSLRLLTQWGQQPADHSLTTGNDTVLG